MAGAVRFASVCKAMPLRAGWSWRLLGLASQQTLSQPERELQACDNNPAGGMALRHSRGRGGRRRKVARTTDSPRVENKTTAGEAPSSSSLLRESDSAHWHAVTVTGQPARGTRIDSGGLSTKAKGDGRAGRENGSESILGLFARLRARKKKLRKFFRRESRFFYFFAWHRRRFGRKYNRSATAAMAGAGHPKPQNHWSRQPWFL